MAGRDWKRPRQRPSSRPGAELGDHKHLWPAPDAPRDVAMRVVESAKRTGRRLCYWNGLWFAWCGTHYQRMTHEGFRDELYELLADAKYQGAKSELRWKPRRQEAERRH